MIDLSDGNTLIFIIGIISLFVKAIHDHREIDRRLDTIEERLKIGKYKVKQ